MKTIDIRSPSPDLDALLDEAEREDLVVRRADGSEFMLTAVDELDREIASTRRNAKLIAFLDERAKEQETIPLEDVKRQLGL